MATRPECEQAVQSLVERYASLDPGIRNKHAVARTVACRVPDLGLVFRARIDSDIIEDVHCLAGTDTGGAQVRLEASSDDLVALLRGELAPPVAWALGRLKIEASVLDLLKLRSLL